MQPMKPMMPNSGKPSLQAKRVESKPDHKATKAAKKSVPQRDGLAKFARNAAKGMR